MLILKSLNLDIKKSDQDIFKGSGKSMRKYILFIFLDRLFEIV